MALRGSDAVVEVLASRIRGGAVIAMTNSGGIRTDITKKGDGAVTYADVLDRKSVV